jgi:hypothetical protein
VNVVVVGWLGGDAAASVPLPNKGDIHSQPRKIVWLFADSLIGVSTPTRLLDFVLYVMV